MDSDSSQSAAGTLHQAPEPPSLRPSESAPSCPGVARKDRRRAALLNRLLTVLIPVTVLCGAFQWWARPSAYLHFILVLGAAGLATMAYVLNRMDCYKEAAILTSVLPTAGSFVSLVVTPAEFIAFAYPSIGILLAGLLLSIRLSAALGAINILMLLALPLVQGIHTYPVVAAAIGFNVFVPILVVLGARNREQEEQDRRSELVESEERWRSLITYHPDPITISVNGRYEFANAACLSLIGATHVDQIVGRRVSEFTHPEHHPLLAARIEQIRAGNRTDPLPLRMLGVDGKERRVEASSVPIGHPDGAAAITVLRNVTEQWVAERRLKASEERYRTIVEHAPEALVVMDTRTGRFVECNGNAERLFGLTGEELALRTPVMVSPATQSWGLESETEWKRFIQCALGKGACDFEWSFEGVDGVVPCEVRLVRLPFQEGPLVRASITDVTDKRAAEAALRASEARHRMLIETMSDGLVAVDKELRITLVNDRFREIFAADCDMIGRSLLELVEPEAREVLAEQYERRRQGISEPYDLRARRLDGAPIRVRVSPSVLRDANGKYAGSFGVVRDVTETEKLEADRRLAEAKIRTLVEHASDLITVLDSRGRIVFESPSLERMLGYRPEEILGRFVTEFVHDEDVAAVNLALMRGVQSPGVPKQVELRLLHKDGSWRTVEAVGQVLANSLDDWQVVVNSRDISERRRLERELLSISSREQRSFGQDLHDGMGQVLVAARLYAAGLAKSLQRKGADEADGVLEIGRMLDEAHELARALARGLSPVSLEEGGFSSALHDLAEGVEKIHGVDCTVRVPDALPLDDLDVATHLYRIAQEALTNAARHAEAKHIDITLQEQKQIFTLTVRDDGLGISPEGRSTGMGIPIMRKRASMLRGALHVSSDPSGTVVTCAFPVNREHDATQPSAGWGVEA